MKVILILCALAYCSNAATLTVGEFVDQVDPAPILENKDTTIKLFECLMDRAPCGDFQVMKEMIPKALKSNCRDCTPKQKEKFNNTLEKFKMEYNDMYKAVMDKYVPESSG